jgi:hypothetical protein
MSRIAAALAVALLSFEGCAVDPAEVRSTEVHVAEVHVDKVRVNATMLFPPLIPSLDPFLQLREMFRIRHGFPLYLSIQETVTR